MPTGPSELMTRVGYYSGGQGNEREKERKTRLRYRAPGLVTSNGHVDREPYEAEDATENNNNREKEKKDAYLHLSSVLAWR